VIAEGIELDPITIILIVVGVLATICLVGIVRNWNKSTGSTNASGPQIHLTLVGWILALFAVGVAITSIILAWQAGWLPPVMLPGLGMKGIIGLSVLAGLLSFYVPALLLRMLGIRAWQSENPIAPKPRQVRFRLDDKKSDDRA